MKKFMAIAVDGLFLPLFSVIPLHPIYTQKIEREINRDYKCNYYNLCYFDRIYYRQDFQLS